MTSLNLSDIQSETVQQPFSKRIFLEGVAGCGKTTAAFERLNHMLHQGVPGESILVLTPQRALAVPFLEAYQASQDITGGPVTFLTVGGLAQRMVNLFWPQIASTAGFEHHRLAPTFLTLETTQYFMARIVRPLLDQGFFNSITIDRNRLYSQIVDNLNKAAVVGFPFDEIGERLKAAWNGDPGQLRVYDDVQHCVRLFRQYCLEHNLLDFSLQIEIFLRQVWPNTLCRDYLISTYRHLFIDNIEEDVPIAHDLYGEWLGECASACVIYDENAGFRRFLGANPDTGYAIKQQCDSAYQFSESFVMDDHVADLADILGNTLAKNRNIKNKKLVKNASLALHFENKRFFPAMLDWICDQVVYLIHEQGVLPGEIAILSPFLSDALRFSIIHRLESLGVLARSHRPSRALRDEPAAQCLINLSLLAHPSWTDSNSGIRPNRFDIAYTLMQAIDGLDLIRAQILATEIFSSKQGEFTLASFSGVKPENQDRISYRIGEKYDQLHQWLAAYRASPPMELDHFISRLFGEVLSQPGFGFHNNFLAGEITFNLMESIQKFRWIGENGLDNLVKSMGSEYLDMIHEGVIAAQYLRSWETWPSEAVMVLPAYTFLMYNRPVEYQFWLDTGSRGWSERLYQPLTQPYVLSRNWNPEQVWSDINEVEVSEDALNRLSVGLLQRCRSGIYLGLSDLGEQGYEQRGELLRAFQRVLQALA